MASRAGRSAVYLQAVLSTATGNPGSLSNLAARSTNRRRSERRSLILSASANSPNEGGIPVLIRDISPGGLLIQAKAGTLKIDDEVTFWLADDTPVHARVAWMSERLFGCEFKTPVSVATVSAALLKAEPRSTIGHIGYSGPPRSQGVSKDIVPEASFSLALILAILLWAAGAAVLALVL